MHGFIHSHYVVLPLATTYLVLIMLPVVRILTVLLRILLASRLVSIIVGKLLSCVTHGARIGV